MIVLALDTSHGIGSAALAGAAGAVESLEFGRGSSHLTAIDAVIDELCRRQGCAINDVDRVALVVGPGSFTGLRIAMAWVKGLFAGGVVEVVTMDGLELMAVGAAGEYARLAPLIDARRGEVYTGLYEAAGESGVRCLIAPHASAPSRLATEYAAAPTLFFGTGAEAYRAEIERVIGGAAVFDPGVPARPSTALLSRLAARLHPLSEGQVLGLEPFYIRASDAKLRPLKKIGS